MKKKKKIKKNVSEFVKCHSCWDCKNTLVLFLFVFFLIKKCYTLNDIAITFVIVERFLKGYVALVLLRVFVGTRSLKLAEFP